MAKFCLKRVFYTFVIIVFVSTFLFMNAYAVTKSSSKRGKKTASKIEEIQKQLPPGISGETVVRIKPEAIIFLPEGSFEISILQEFDKAVVKFGSRYDFLDNSMGFMLDFSYNFPKYVLGLLIKDEVDFNEVFSNTEYLQRTQSLSPYMKYSLKDKSYIRTGFRFETTYTDSLDTNFRLDSGKNIIGEIGIFKNTVDKTKTLPRGTATSLNIENSFQNLGSDYSYTQGEFKLNHYFNLFRKHYINYNFVSGYPLEVTNRPLTSYYKAGGYRMMRGYDFEEFWGDAILYNSIEYNIPLAGIKRAKFLGMKFSVLTWNIFTEAIKIGDKDIYSKNSDIKSNFGMGIGYTMILFKYFPVEIQASIAKAMDPKFPKLYLTISTVRYSYKDE